MDIFRAALLRSYFQIAEIHFSWDRIYIYTYLRIRKFQLSRLNGVKISQFPSRVSILESSTIFSDESVPSVPRNRLFPTFEIRKGRENFQKLPRQIYSSLLNSNLVTVRRNVP